MLGELVPAGILRRLLLGVLPHHQASPTVICARPASSGEACVESLGALTGPEARGRNHHLASSYEQLLLPLYFDDPKLPGSLAGNIQFALVTRRESEQHLG